MSNSEYKDNSWFTKAKEIDKLAGIDALLLTNHTEQAASNVIEFPKQKTAG